MKYNVLGFYQPRAVELGLCSDDLLVLRWFVDFAGTPKMRTMIIDNQIYYWVNYSTVLEELPILRISKQTLYKKHFTNLCNANVLTHKQVKDGGNFSYYCYGINYETLVYLQSEEDPLVKNTDLVSKCTKGSVEIYQTLVSESTEQINNPQEINNLQNNNKKERKKDYNEQIENFTDNSKLKDTIFDFIKMRKLSKKPMTDRALSMLLNKLSKYNDEIKIKMLEQSIMKNWLDVYELKSDNTYNKSNNSIDIINELLNEEKNKNEGDIVI